MVMGEYTEEDGGETGKRSLAGGVHGASRFGNGLTQPLYLYRHSAVLPAFSHSNSV